MPPPEPAGPPSVGPPGWAPPTPRLGGAVPGPRPVGGPPSPDPDAAIGRRFLAMLVDFAVLGALTALGVMIAGTLVPDRAVAIFVDDPSGAGTAVVFAVWLGFFGVCEAYCAQTPGKRLLRVAVVRFDDARPAGIGAIVLRTVLRVLDQFVWGVALVCMVLSGKRRRQRVGDLAAGTVVVHTHGPPREFAGLVMTGAAVAVPILVTLAALSPLWPAVGVRGDAERVESAAKRFLAAVAKGDVAAACAASSHAQQLDEVARAGRSGRGPSTCAARGRIPARDRALAARIRGAALVVHVSPDRELAVASVIGRTTLPLVPENGEWKVDELGVVRHGFVRGCAASGVHPGRCGCVFDQLRARGVRSEAALLRMGHEARSGTPGRTHREALLTCGYRL